jgi:hypothetical protein
MLNGLPGATGSSSQHLNIRREMKTIKRLFDVEVQVIVLALFIGAVIGCGI